MTVHEADCTVIGAGPGGYVAAIRLAQLGKKVIVIERDRLGGTCLNYGCIPSKALIHASRLFDRIREEAGDLGIRVGEPEIDMGRLMTWKGGVVKKLTGGIGQLFKAHKIETIIGEASFRNTLEVEVKAADGPHVVRSAATIIATGGRPFELPNMPFDGTHVISAREALELQEVPQDLVVVGGGVIGLEIGTVYHRLGARVTVVEMMDQLLPGIDPDLVAVVARKLKKRGVKTFLKSRAQGIERKGDKLEVVIEGPDGRTTVPADKVLVAVGWKPHTAGLELERAGVHVNERGFIHVDEAMRTTAPGIWAIGDAAGAPLLAHKASKEGIIAAESVAGLATVRDWRAMPAAVFTDPEIASVGMTPEQARESGYEPKVGRFPFSANGRALSTNEAEGFAQVVVDKASGLLLGLHVVGPEASNLVAEGTLAIEMGAVAEDLALTIHAHPTLPEAVMEAAEMALGHAIHAVSR